MSKVKKLHARQQNQVILSGPQSQVDQLVQSMPKKFVASPLASFQVADGLFTIVLIQYGNSPSQDETDALNAALIQAARSAGLTAIRTEPNYTVVAPPGWRGEPYDWEGNPYDWEGNPYDWEGNPYDWEGNPNQEPPTPASPMTLPVGATAAEAVTLFQAQSAFALIELTQNGQRNPRLSNLTGEGVLVGLFDSCPTAQELTTLPGGAPAWLQAHYPTPNLTGGAYVDHGLFNASLVNFIAPGAEIHLYQALNGEVYGETTWLITALADFLNLAGDQPTVTNLSLGSLSYGFTGMPAIEALLSELIRRGGIICAAAGNRASQAGKVAAVPQAQMPASLPYVIAVSAVSQQMARSTFAQRGDIAAPGGESLGNGGPNGLDDIIGLGTTSPTGYIRMDGGTSFATPLVAGAAALVASKLLQQGAQQSPEFWQQVFGQLATTAVQPAGEPGALNTTGLGAGILQVTPPNA